MSPDLRDWAIGKLMDQANVPPGPRIPPCQGAAAGGRCCRTLPAASDLGWGPRTL